MKSRKNRVETLLLSLQERAKELECFYAVQSVLSTPNITLDEICRKLIEIIPPGWQYPELCTVKVSIGGSVYQSPGFVETPWSLSADILVQNRVVGFISVYYATNPASQYGRPFLDEESRLLNMIAARIGDHLWHGLESRMLSDWTSNMAQVPDDAKCEWQLALNSLRGTNPELYQRITRKMLNYLCWSGVPEAEQLLRSAWPSRASVGESDAPDDWNRPRQRHGIAFTSYLGARVFALASDHMDCPQILQLIQMWIQEDKQSFLVQLINTNVPVSTVADIIRRYHEMSKDPSFVPVQRTRGILIAMIRRFLSEQRAYVDVAKEMMEINDFHFLLDKMIYTNESHGRLGGKSAGLYLANQIVKKKASEYPILADIKTPRTWYVTSDVLFHFVHHCDFDELIEQKYKPIQQVRMEYPCISQAFAAVTFPEDIVRGLSTALDDFGTNPIVVRSSSLLEDSIGAAFSGKYKSLFLANQGSKRHRLEALTDAVAEVYASTFSPDAIEYRADRGLLDYNEEMGIMIQEVVGTKIGKYFLPAFGGVAFGCNEFLWSPRIKREDGLLRMVPGLGTRAVDRLGDDYPVLISPGNPGIRVNVTPSDVYRYSPGMMDVINLDTASFESVDIESFVGEVDGGFELFRDVFSAYRDDTIAAISPLGMDREREKPVATFDRLITRTDFLQRIRTMMNVLEDTLGFPVDIEFASDGTDLYLLQCRPQSPAEVCAPGVIPKYLEPEQIMFTARKHISNGYVPDISHIVYVDPDSYASLPSRGAMIEVGRAISELNKLLPRRRFILMGPGRWGSRGDIKLGVSVDYSDINNTSMLIEIAFQKGQYLPELSFGTHFFQDLVEAHIRYLPLYPDDPKVVFNRVFLRESSNRFAELVPGLAHLEHVIHVIDVPEATGGLLLTVSMNADRGEAVGYVCSPRDKRK
ncbi:pyruvate, phosphate dikinase [candidate division GN15 bacterium]|nr:pyruvate, phosphate dikinase [candidate division GN15 bacterium]